MSDYSVVKLPLNLNITDDLGQSEVNKNFTSKRTWDLDINPYSIVEKLDQNRSSSVALIRK